MFQNIYKLPSQSWLLLEIPDIIAAEMVHFVISLTGRSTEKVEIPVQTILYHRRLEGKDNHINNKSTQYDITLCIFYYRICFLLMIQIKKLNFKC